MVNPIFQQDEELLLNQFGSKYLPSGTYTDVNSNQFVVQEDAVISVLTGGDASITENNIDYKASMSLSGVTLKKGALIVAPVREAFKSITIDSGAIMAYNCVVEGEKPVPFIGLLDLYSDAAAAYSLRKLRADYTGDAIRVRIDTTGQPTYEIGFDSNDELDTVELLSKAAGNDAYVHTWYDQSGLGNDASQAMAANQPKIVSSGSVILENGKPTILWNGTNNYLDSSMTIDSNFTSISIAKTSNELNNAKLILDETNLKGLLFVSANTFNWYDGVSNYNIGSSNVLQNLFYISTNQVDSKVIVNGVDKNINTILNNGYGSLRIGGRVGVPQHWNGNSQEIIFYPTDQRDNYAGIESNINSHYNIY